MKLGELNQKVQQRMEEEKSAVEDAARQTLERLQQSLSACADAALTTTENAIRSRSEAMSQRLKEDLQHMATRYNLLNWSMLRAWVCHLLLAVALLLGLMGGSWGFMHLTARDVRQLQQEIAALEQERESVKQTIAELESKTWGWRLHSDKNGRFIILPLGMKAITGWEVGKQKALKLE